MLLNEKIVVISGIGPGLGAKLATNAAKEGAVGLALCGRTPQKLATVAEEIRREHRSAEILEVITDIRSTTSCQAAITRIRDHYGRIDALVNNAYEHGSFEATEQADVAKWQHIFATNLTGTMQFTQAVVPAMASQGGGSIVMINTQAVRKPVVLPMGAEAGYAASKAALATATKYLALELGRSGIRVNTALMGWMWGKSVQEYVRYMADQRGVSEQTIIDEIRADIPLNRIVTDEECARAALFLASDYASGITGASLDVNGGEFMP